MNFSAFDYYTAGSLWQIFWSIVAYAVFIRGFIGFYDDYKKRKSTKKLAVVNIEHTCSGKAVETNCESEQKNLK